jgi:hypothetical protein
MCRKSHQFAFEIGLRRIDDAKALRMGSAGHAGVETLGKGGTLAEACAAVESYYTNCPSQFDLHQWQIECETMRRLIAAYQWRWEGAGVVNVQTEFTFRLPLANPATGKATPVFDLGGKIDGIVRLEDGRLAVKETKFLSEDLDANAPLWRRLRRDAQISTYMIAARKSGYDVQTVLYDTIRKPAISPTAVPILDGEGKKIVLDATGERIRNATGKKDWRQTGDSDKGWTIQVRPMTVEEFGDKLTNDIAERPDWYFARREIARLDGDLAETEAEIWSIQQDIRDAQKSGHWYRTATKNTCQWCAYDAICDTPIDPRLPPIGYEIIYDLHPELLLGDTSHVSTSITPETATACSAESVGT